VRAKDDSGVATVVGADGSIGRRAFILDKSTRAGPVRSNLGVVARLQPTRIGTEVETGGNPQS
jgi:hypothetical protein